MPPLSGLTVVALEHAVAAPFATRQLADLGARVIKIERPDGGTSRCLQRFRLRHDRAVCRKKSHTDAILEELDFARDTIDAWRAAGVI